MLIRWSDIDNTFAWMDAWRRRMDQLVNDWDDMRGTPGDVGGWVNAWPRMEMRDNGTEITVRALVPGLSDKDVKVTMDQDVLTLSGERKVEIPQGWHVHRQERQNVKFTRSLALPCKVDAERTTAAVKNGILTVKLPKTPESQPRQITVKAS